jgi:hypothetical protein
MTNTLLCPAHKYTQSVGIFVRPNFQELKNIFLRNLKEQWPEAYINVKKKKKTQTQTAPFFFFFTTANH